VQQSSAASGDRAGYGRELLQRVGKTSLNYLKWPAGNAVLSGPTSTVSVAAGRTVSRWRGLQPGRSGNSARRKPNYQEFPPRVLPSRHSPHGRRPAGVHHDDGRNGPGRELARPRLRRTFRPGLRSRQTFDLTKGMLFLRFDGAGRRVTQSSAISRARSLAMRLAELAGRMKRFEVREAAAPTP